MHSHRRMVWPRGCSVLHVKWYGPSTSSAIGCNPKGIARQPRALQLAEVPLAGRLMQLAGMLASDGLLAQGMTKRVHVHSRLANENCQFRVPMKSCNL